jgi:hypothetical protein
MRQATLLFAACLVATPAAVDAQSEAQCRTIEKNADGMIAPAIVNLNRVESMGRQIGTLKSSSEELRPELDRFDEARQDLAVALRAFIDASRALRDKSEACAGRRRR